MTASPAHAPSAHGHGHATGGDNDDGEGPAHLDPAKRHRHDVGEVAHGPESSVRTTRALQVLLGLWIFLTAALVIWAMAAPAELPSGASVPASPTAPASR